jgi:hypothetical protein
MRRQVFSVILGGLVVAFAQLAAPTLRADCYSTQQKLLAEQVEEFSLEPSKLLQRFPEGGAAMISLIRDLVASSPSTLQKIMSLVANSNDDQRKALGTGLGQASVICLRTDQPYATEIQRAVAEIGNGVVTLAFASATGDRPIGAIGGGGAGSPGSFGGSTAGFGSESLRGFGTSNQSFAAFATQTSPQNFFTSSTSSAQAARSSESVSPSR